MTKKQLYQSYYDNAEVKSVVDHVLSKRYVTSINPTIEEWKYQDLKVTYDAAIAYEKLLKDNNLNGNDFKAVLGWYYENDDYIKNRITLVIEAKPINEL